MPPAEISWPRKAMLSTPKVHFDGLRSTPFWERRRKTSRKWTRCCGQVGAGDEYVVDVDEDEVESAKNLVDEPLEGLCAVAEAVRHAQELERAERGCDRCFRDVFRGHRNLVERLDEIKSCVDGSSSEAGREVVKVR